MKNEGLCLERDAFRCRVCGSTDDVKAVRLIDREGEVAYQLSNLVSLCSECSVAKNFTPHKNRVGVMLCGGKATRLYPLTQTTNKHILPVGLSPMGFYGIRVLRKFGISRVLIVIDQFSSSIVDTFGSGKMFGMDFSYKIQNGSFGISDALYLAKDFADPKDEIVCILGDNIFGQDVDFEIDLQNNKACVFVKEVENPSEYGVAEVKDGRVVEIIEKPPDPKTNLAVVGLYAYTYDVFDVINSVSPSKRGELEISSVNDYYAKSGQLAYKVVNGYWADCGGSIQRYCEASLYGAKRAKVSSDEVDMFKAVVFDDK